MFGFLVCISKQLFPFLYINLAYNLTICVMPVLTFFALDSPNVPNHFFMTDEAFFRLIFPRKLISTPQLSFSSNIFLQILAMITAREALIARLAL